MPITITNKIMSDAGDYVIITLSDGNDIAISSDWINQIDPVTGKSLLELEIEAAPIRAQARADAAALDATKIQAVLDSIA